MLVRTLIDDVANATAPSAGTESQRHELDEAIESCLLALEVDRPGTLAEREPPDKSGTYRAVTDATARPLK
jgi:hypothetical protein